VEALLKHHFREDDVLETPAVDVQASLCHEAPIPTEGPGTVIGNYTLLEKIGEGGCGVVFKARQERPLRREVALKVIKLGMDTKEVIARFNAERQALARMSHSHIAKVIDAGATTNGRPYFVMECVQGVKITAYCDDHRLTMEDRLRLFSKVCQAVQHAHQKGVIHRDLKPSNILVTTGETEKDAAPKVIDFGIAKATGGERLTDITLITLDGHFLGTPAYMSPEQASGGESTVDTQSDIYSLGVILYELLTGVTPFAVGELQAAGPIGMRRIIVEREPQRPPHRLTTLKAGDQTRIAQLRRADAMKLRHLLKGDLDRVVMKALEKNKELRYQTAVALADDLGRYLRHEPVMAIPPSAGYRLRKFVRRNRIGVALATGIALMMVAGLWLNVRETRRATAAEQRANREQQAALVSAQKSQQTAQLMTDMLQAAGPSVAAGRDTKLLWDILDATMHRLDAAHDLFPEVESDLRERIGQALAEIGRVDEARQMYERALSIQLKLHAEDHPDVLHAMAVLSGVISVQGKQVEYDALSRRILELTRKHYGAGHFMMVPALRQCAQAKVNLGQLAQAEALYREAMNLGLRLFGENDVGLVETLSDLGRTLEAQDRNEEAALLFQRAMEINSTHQEHVDMATSLDDMSFLSFKTGKLQQAEAYSRRALTLRTQYQGKSHIDTSLAHEHLAVFLQSEGKLQEAESHFRQGLTLLQKLFPKSSPMFTSAVKNLAGNLTLQGKKEEAAQLLHQFEAPAGAGP
jgi:eukaryotic-like serine/threonine-protein kinase